MTQDGLLSRTASALITSLWGRQDANVNELELKGIHFEIVHLLPVKNGTKIKSTSYRDYGPRRGKKTPFTV